MLGLETLLENMGKIPGGYILKARKIADSAIAHAPPHVREVWDYLLRTANWKDGKKGKRGELYTSYEKIAEALEWKVGFRIHRYTKAQIDKAIRWLRESDSESDMKATMIATTRTTRGFFIRIVRYSYYQDPNNYESDSESDNERETRATARAVRYQKKVEEGKHIQEPEASPEPATVELSKLLSIFSGLHGVAYRVTVGRADKYRQRNKTFTHEELRRAAGNIKHSDFHMGKNERGWKADPDWLLRNDENVDRMLNLPEAQPKKPRQYKLYSEQ